MAVSAKRRNLPREIRTSNNYHCRWQKRKMREAASETRRPLPKPEHLSQTGVETKNNPPKLPPERSPEQRAHVKDKTAFSEQNLKHQFTKRLGTKGRIPMVL